MNEWAAWETEKVVAKTAAALAKNGFGVEVVPDARAAAALIMGYAADAQTVGFGGSVSAVEAELPGLLRDAGKTCLIHGAPGLSPEERLAIMRRQLTCDLFLCGTNAVTLDGRLVNIDATGNRVGAMTFGPKKVAVLAGSNKIAWSLDAALDRVRNFAAPANAHRLGYRTPCATTGFCADCDSPERICRAVTVLEKRPRLTDVVVILTLEALGL